MSYSKCDLCDVVLFDAAEYCDDCNLLLQNRAQHYIDKRRSRLKEMTLHNLIKNNADKLMKYYK